MHGLKGRFLPFPARSYFSCEALFRRENGEQTSLLYLSSPVPKLARGCLSRAMASDTYDRLSDSVVVDDLQSPVEVLGLR